MGSLSPNHPPPPLPKRPFLFSLINELRALNPDQSDPVLAKLKSGFTTKVDDFKALFAADPTMLSLGQFHISKMILKEFVALVNSDLAKVPDDDMRHIWNDMLGTGEFKTDRLLEYVKNHHLESVYPNIVKVFSKDPSATSVWAGTLYDQYWHNENLAPSINITSATRDRYVISLTHGGPILNGKRIGENSACFDSTTSLAKKYVKALSLPTIPAELRISPGQIPETNITSKKDLITYNPITLREKIQKIKATLDKKYPVICGVLSGEDQLGLHGFPSFPTPEHYLLVFAYFEDIFLFWDSDSNRSNIAGPDWGKGFGVLFATDNRFSTGTDDADLAAFVRGGKFSGDHVSLPRRHRYQVYYVRT